MPAFFPGTIFDLVWLNSYENAYKDIYLAGGASVVFTRFFPMREGKGNYCTCINSGAVLSGFSAFSWTTEDLANGHRWV